jgi:alkylation response protein AidB-like acyl-CoA dehydrogenase
MFNFQVTANTRELMAKIEDWSIRHVRPHARFIDDNCRLPDEATIAAVAKECPIRHSPLDFWSSGPGVKGREHDKEYVSSLNGGRSVLGMLATEAVFAGDGWGLQTLPGDNMAEVAVRRMGNAEQIHKWADGIRRGEYRRTSMAMTEKHCGLDLSQIKTTAIKQGDHWVLNGGKDYISHAAYSDFLIVLAQTIPGSGFKGARAFIVDRHDEGLVVTVENYEKLGARSYAQAAVEFRNIVLAEDRLLSSGSLKDFVEVQAATRPFCGLQAIGIASTMLKYAVNWVNTNDRPWSPRRRDRFAEVVEDARGALDKARRMVLHAGWTHDQGRADNVLGQRAKGYATAVGERVAFRAMQLMGPEAWSKDHLMEKWYRDVKFNDMMGGTRNLHRLAVARAEFGPAVQ